MVTDDSLQQAEPNGSACNKHRFIDPYGRELTYLRLAVTDRCNLRCKYCMPEQGIQFLPKTELLTLEEMERLIGLLVNRGVTKLRLTGGEPLIRKGIIGFLQRVAGLPGLQNIHITTNGITTHRYLPELKALGIQGINLSLDTLSRDRFRMITGCDGFDDVITTFYGALRAGIPLKINTVVMDQINIEDIVPIANLAREHPVEVRFIEQMPFNGSGKNIQNHWTAGKILQELKRAFPDMHRAYDQSSTALNFNIPGFIGRVGIIGGYSRLFCQTCNRIRITTRGIFKTCLYDDGRVDLRRLLREGASDEQIISAINLAIADRARNGFEAEARSTPTEKISMSTIGG